jgi:hypothetical protein
MPPEGVRSDTRGESETSWLEPLLGIPVAFHSGDVSIRELFGRAEPDLDDHNFRPLVESALARRPDLIEAWQIYSSDKRVSEGPYLEGNEVGYYSAGRQDVRRHDTPAAACADFVHREANQVIRGRGVT